MQLIEVAFKGNRKDFFLWEGDDPPPLRAAVIVDADRGEDLGYVHAVGALAEQRNAGTPHGYGAAGAGAGAEDAGGGGATKHARRLAGPEDVQRAEELRAQDEDARRRAMERVKANALVMKLSDAEWQWDRKKLTLYFTAERRVDFRTLVRELASMFRTRIELKQIGVRDEAKRLDGIGRCGRQYCSSSWLPELRPVNLGVAKDQRLSLNPSQISGACGRLMCCLRYEHEFYVQSRKRFPKEGRLVRTTRGEEKVVSNDIFRERVVLRNAEGDVRSIALAELRQEAEAAGVALPLPASRGASETAAEPDAAAADDAADDAVDLALEEGLDEEDAGADSILDEEGAGANSILAEDGESAPTDSGDAAPGASEKAKAKRAHRRRGRRGGRRNRQAGRGPRGDTPPGTDAGADPAPDRGGGGSAGADSATPNGDD